ncbi:hypothetical protein [Breoghania sp. L-A4]|uniref:hypothetical protein n=1 Tax=Breoghania sp. L-A4 TaxID=2304600 RepID=UPI000E35A3CD|nr:hypothetical protein [Breoghania sp. L-A4]AXS39975.1 hypothetical protein D1F64_07760 [Breoghania sp. L-A4]
MPIALAGLAGIAAQVGAPLIAGLFRKQLGGAAGELAGSVVDEIAKGIGVPNTPIAIETAFRENPTDVGEAFRQVDVERREDLAAMLAEVNATMRAEQTAPGLLTRIWRPLFGIQFGLVYSAIGAVLAYTVGWAENPVGALGLTGGYITTYLGFGASVLGVYVWQRSSEKKAGRG